MLSTDYMTAAGKTCFYCHCEIEDDPAIEWHSTPDIYLHPDCCEALIQRLLPDLRKAREESRLSKVLRSRVREAKVSAVRALIAEAEARVEDARRERELSDYPRLDLSNVTLRRPGPTSS